MNKKYERYIEYIVNDIQPPYFKNMRDNYGLSPDEYFLVLRRIFNQPVSVTGHYVYDNQGNNIYYENSDGDWRKWEYDDQGNKIYYETNTGYWAKRKYDDQGNEIYWGDSDGDWTKWEYDERGNIIYHEDSNGNIRDNR